MVKIENILISEEIFDEYFLCNLTKCKGSCCVEGDAGAPLKENELTILDDIYDEVKAYLPVEHQEIISKQGKYTQDIEGKWVTPLVNQKQCVYSFFDNAKDSHSCGIEKAYLEGKIDYKKPISCHLYPIRVLDLKHLKALNYHRWDICSAACNFGDDNKVKLYEFAKDSLVREFGQSWYNQLLETAKKRIKRAIPN